MDVSTLGKYRLLKQQISGTSFSSVKNLVSWMGAIQAQDYEMAKWAIGLRVKGASNRSVGKSIAKGKPSYTCRETFSRQKLLSR